MTDLWLNDELEAYVQQGYNEITLRTGCLWQTDVAPDVPSCFAYTQEWELPYLPAGVDANGPFSFTCIDDRDFADNAEGPANHNHRWEYVQEYVTNAGMSTEIAAVVDLPTDLYEIERAVWNTIPIDATRSRNYEMDDTRYELTKGAVEAYTQDKDGLRRLRKWRRPSSAYEPYAMDSSSSDYGILVNVSDIDSDTPGGGAWGDFVQVGGEHAMGDPWGIIVAIYREQNNVRYEYRRRGATLTDSQGLEIPERYQVYARHFAQAKALEREGDGQDLELSDFYRQRYEAGVQRMLKRKAAMNYQRKFVRGGGRQEMSRKPYPKFPYPYPAAR